LSFLTTLDFDHKLSETVEGVQNRKKTSV